MERPCGIPCKGSNRIGICFWVSFVRQSVEDGFTGKEFAVLLKEAEKQLGNCKQPEQLQACIEETKNIFIK